MPHGRHAPEREGHATKESVMWESCNGAGDANSSSFMQEKLIGSEIDKTWGVGYRSDTEEGRARGFLKPEWENP
jgi:hypothetical protein